MPNQNQHCSCHLQKLTYLVILQGRFGFSTRSQSCEIRHGALQQVAASDCSCRILRRPKDTNSKHALPEDVGHRCQCSHSSEDAARLSSMNIAPVMKLDHMLGEPNERGLTIPPSSFWQPHWHSTSCPEAVLPPASLASSFAVRLRYGLRAAMWSCVSDSNGKVSVVGGV